MERPRHRAEGARPRGRGRRPSRRGGRSSVGQEGVSISGRCFGDACQFRGSNVSSSPQRQHRHDETQSLQEVGGCNESDQAQATAAQIGGLKPEPVHRESGGRITGREADINRITWRGLVLAYQLYRRLTVIEGKTERIAESG